MSIDRPIFFLSYAHDDQTRQLDDFYDSLVESVRMKCGVVRDATAFRYTHGTPIGAEWKRELGNALQTCAVFVPILTRSYFLRPDCGKEWGYFRLRQDAAPPPRPPLVIPVLWGAKRDVLQTAPADALSLDYDAKDFPDEYEELGLATLMRQQRYRDQREIVIEGLARRIQEVSERGAPILDPAPAYDDVPALFPTPASRPTLGGDTAPRVTAPTRGPRFVEFILVAGTAADLETARSNCTFYGESALDWCPYRPEIDRSAALVASRVANDRKFLNGQSVPDETLATRLREAEQRNNIVVLLVDTWTLHVERYRGLMREFDQANYANAAVVIVWNSGDDETTSSESVLDRMVSHTFFHRSYHAPAARSFGHVRSATQFRRDLASVLETTYGRMLAYAHARRPVEPTPRPTLSPTTP